jgi:hypothetical protein
MPIDGSLTLRLGKRIMVRAELTLHSVSTDRPKVSYQFRRNDIDVYIDGDRDYSILYFQHQTELTPLNFNIRNFNLTLGARWDYLRYKDRLVSARSTDITLENDHYISYRATANYNSEDNWNFPSRGTRFKAEYAYLTDNFAKMSGKAGMSDVNANWRMSIPLSSHLSVQPMIYGRMLFGKTTANRPSRFLEESGVAFEVPRRQSHTSSRSAGFTKSTYSTSPPRPGSADRKQIASIPTASLPDLSVGLRVTHSAFGEGTVTKMIPMGGDQLLEIFFDGHGPKKLMLKAAVRYLKTQ